MIGIGNNQLMKSNISQTIDGKYIWNIYNSSSSTSGSYGRLSSDYGVSYTNKTGSSYLLAGDISNSGMYGSAPIFLAPNYNTYYRFYNTFANSSEVTVTDCGGVERSSISGNGQYWIFGTQSGFGISTNYGATAAKSTTFPEVNDSIGGQAISYTGQYIIASNGYSTNTWSSDDYGSTWNVEHNHLVATLDSASMSASGQYRQLCFRNVGSYYSNDYGVSYTASTGLSPWSNPLRTSMCNSGEFQLAAMGNKLYRSTDYGISFSQITGILSLYYFSISVSGTGETMIAGVYSSSGIIIRSTDYGVTWSTLTTFPIGRQRTVVLNKYTESYPG